MSNLLPIRLTPPQKWLMILIRKQQVTMMSSNQPHWNQCDHNIWEKTKHVLNMETGNCTNAVTVGILSSPGMVALCDHGDLLKPIPSSVVFLERSAGGWQRRSAASVTSSAAKTQRNKGKVQFCVGQLTIGRATPQWLWVAPAPGGAVGPPPPVCPWPLLPWPRMQWALPQPSSSSSPSLSEEDSPNCRGFS